MDREHFRLKYPNLFVEDIVDESASGFESCGKTTCIQPTFLGNNEFVNMASRKLLNIPKSENNSKHVQNESVDVKNKPKHDHANLTDFKREKNLKVHSFLRNLGIRIMKVFQVKDS